MNNNQNQPTPLTQKILLTLSQHLGVDEKSLVPTADLANDLNLHALELADLASILSEAFQIEISPEESTAWETVADILHTVTEKASPPEPEPEPQP